MKSKLIVSIVAAILFGPFLMDAQLIVMASPVKAEGNKAVVKLNFKNDLTNAVESARASVYLLNGETVVGHETRWVIGGAKDKPTLAPGATNSFFFVLSSDKSFPRTNLTAKVSINRLVLEGGKLGDASKDVSVTSGK